MVQVVFPYDVLYPYAIEDLVGEAKKLPENTIHYSNWEIIDENGNKVRSFSESNYNDLNNFEFNVRLLNGQQINVNTSLIPSKSFSDFFISLNSNFFFFLANFYLFAYSSCKIIGIQFFISQQSSSIYYNSFFHEFKILV